MLTLLGDEAENMGISFLAPFKAGDFHNGAVGMVETAWKPITIL